MDFVFDKKILNLGFIGILIIMGVIYIAYYFKYFRWALCLVYACIAVWGIWKYKKLLVGMLKK